MSALWEDEDSLFEAAFDPSAHRSPCIRLLYIGPNGLMEKPGESVAYTLAEWERLRRVRPEMFVAPDPQNRASTVTIRLVVPGNDRCSRMNNSE